MRFDNTFAWPIIGRRTYSHKPVVTESQVFPNLQYLLCSKTESHLLVHSYRKIRGLVSYMPDPSRFGQVHPFLLRRTPPRMSFAMSVEQFFQTDLSVDLSSVEFCMA